MNGTVVFSIWSKILFQCDVITHTKNENTQKAVKQENLPNFGMIINFIAKYKYIIYSYIFICVYICIQL